MAKKDTTNHVWKDRKRTIFGLPLSFTVYKATEEKLLIESGYYADSSILEQCIEIKKLLVSSINTAKSNAK